MDDILQVWLEAADTSDDWSDPVPTLTRYINAKMELSRTRPKGSKVWANEIIQGAPMIQNYLESTLRIWMQDRTEQIRSWVEAEKIRPVDSYHLLYMIWAVTQHYADFEHQIKHAQRERSIVRETICSSEAEHHGNLAAGNRCPARKHRAARMRRGCRGFGSIAR